MASTAWVRMYCSADRQPRVAVFRSAGETWLITEVDQSPPPPPDTAGGLPVAGQFGISPSYRGCPSCGNGSYARCGNCGELGCWKSTEPHFTCGNCRRGGRVSGELDSLGALDAS
jgi:hypothetical protein